jgi:hypothetical protein
MLMHEIMMFTIRLSLFGSICKKGEQSEYESKK